MLSYTSLSHPSHRFQVQTVQNVAFFLGGCFPVTLSSVGDLVMALQPFC